MLRGNIALTRCMATCASLILSVLLTSSAFLTFFILQFWFQLSCGGGVHGMRNHF